MAKLVFPRRGWAELRAATNHQLHPQADLLRLGSIPGVVVWASGLGAEFHWTTWKLEPVLRLIEMNGCDPDELFERLSLIRSMSRDALSGNPAAASLKPWQVEASNKALCESVLLLADDMGLGKTRAAAVAAHISTLESGRPVVIVGPAYAREVWRSELEKTGLLTAPTDWCALKTRDFDDPSYSATARWIYCHYDIAQAWGTHFTSRPHHLRPGAVIIDEAHWVKEHKAGRSQGAALIAAVASMRILLTGTPIENRPSELWHLLTILCGKGSFGTFTQFRERYCGAYRGHFGWVDREPTHIDELRQRIAPIYLRRTVEDIGPNLLPPLSRQSIVTTLTDAQREKHDAIAHSVPLEELVQALVQGRAGEQTIKLIDRLRKVTSQAKLSTTKKFVVELLEQGRSVVVFCWMRETVQNLVETFTRSEFRLLTEGVYRVDGNMPQKEREAAVAGFQFGGHTSGMPAVLVATYGTLREGVTLTRADNVVLHDMDWKTSVILQAEKRVHRMTQDRPCTSSWMLAENSIDTMFAKVLSMKADYIEKTLGITASTEAVDEVGLREIAPSFDPAEWARNQFGRM